MLGSFIFTQSFTNFLQSSFYFDYIIKKLSEIFVKNYLVYTSLFFGEKFVIELLSKKLVDNIIFFLNNKDYTGYYYYNNFFLQLAVVLFYFLFFLELFYFFY